MSDDEVKTSCFKVLDGGLGALADELEKSLSSINYGSSLDCKMVRSHFSNTVSDLPTNVGNYAVDARNNKLTPTKKRGALAMILNDGNDEASPISVITPKLVSRMVMRNIDVGAFAAEKQQQILYAKSWKFDNSWLWNSIIRNSSWLTDTISYVNVPAGQAYVTVFPAHLSDQERVLVGELMDAYDGWLVFYTNKCTAFRDYAIKHGSVPIPGGQTAYSITIQDDATSKFLNFSAVAQPVFDYVNRNMAIFGQTNYTVTQRSYAAESTNLNLDLVTGLVNAVFSAVVGQDVFTAIQQVASVVTKSMASYEMNDAQTIKQRCIMPIVYKEPVSGSIRMALFIVDYSVVWREARKSGVCSSSRSQSFDYQVSALKYTVDTGVLKGIFGDDTDAITDGKKFKQATKNNGTGTDVETDIPPR